MTPVSEAEIPVETRLKQAVRNHRRAVQRADAARQELHDAIKAAAATDKGPKEITFLIEHEYDVNHVSRIIRGKTNTRPKRADS